MNSPAAPEGYDRFLWYGWGSHFEEFETNKSLKGGAGSGNFGHAGRPGLVGGAGQSEGMPAEDNGGSTALLNTPILIYRLGSKDGSISGRNAGNATAVADHLVRISDVEAPSFVGSAGETISLYSVTLTSEPGSYEAMVRGRSSSTQVGRRVTGSGKDTSVLYSFPSESGDYTYTLLARIPIAELTAELASGGYDSPDDAGIRETANTLRIIADRTLAKDFRALKGGDGSGNFGHAGRPGLVGGSSDDTGSGKTTEELYKNADGTWKPERAALHQKIVKDILGDVPDSSRPTIYIMGGGMAAGKSTILNSGEVTLPGKDVAVHIDPDDIKGRLPEYNGMVANKDPFAGTMVHEESSYVSKLALEAAAKKDVVFDSSGDSTLPKISAKLDAFEAQGKTIRGVYVTCAIDEALRRNQERGDITGRYVPKQLLIEAHKQISANMPRLANRFSSLRVYDTDGPKPRLIMKNDGDITKVIDRGLYQKFLDKVDWKP